MKRHFIVLDFDASLYLLHKIFLLDRPDYKVGNLWQEGATSLEKWVDRISTGAITADGTFTQAS
jgi:hypothetical protein